jgi:hypothetical protein
VTHPDVDPRWLPLLDLWFDQAHEEDHPTAVDGCPDCAERTDPPEPQP